MDDNHMDLWKSETWELAHERAWDRWADEVEKRLGHDLDGCLKEDGYSLDTAYDMWNDGTEVDEAVVRIELAKSLIIPQDES